MSENEFNVWLFFENGPHDQIRHRVSAEEAMKTFAHYTSSVMAKLGIVQRVIVTDGGDYCCAEWKLSEGYTFPPELAVGKIPR
jgi:hypothetical protein